MGDPAVSRVEGSSTVRGLHYFRGVNRALEDTAEILTAAVGLLFAVIGIPFLLIPAFQERNTPEAVGLTLYGVSLFLMYLSSTLFHSAREPRLRHAMRIFDHVCIYLLIAGTYTPLAMILEEKTNVFMLSVVWGTALLGVVTKIFFFRKMERLSVALYLILGWFAFFSAHPLVMDLPGYPMFWILFGSGAYSVGTIFYSWGKLPFHHAIWHIFVLLGSVSHFVGVLLCAEVI